jgi:DNA-binding response OmpR family regulator
MSTLVVVAEDDQDLGTLIKTKLENANLRVLWEENGAKALEAILLHKPALAILDVAMPGLDGLELLDRIKRTPEIQNVPVIIITAMGHEAYARTALSRGAADFIVKPFKTADLLARVMSVLAGK